MPPWGCLDPDSLDTGDLLSPSALSTHSHTTHPTPLPLNPFTLPVHVGFSHFWL